MDKIPEILNKVVTYPEQFCSNKLALISVVGSHNYGIADENSDIDLKIGYFPSFENLFRNSFPMKNVVTNNFDYTTAPIHHLISHALKGNINFMEPWITDLSRFRLQHIKQIRNTILGMFPSNAIRIVLASRGMAITKLNNLHKFSEVEGGTSFYKETLGYNGKEAAHAIRLMYFLVHFLTTGEVRIRDYPGLNYAYAIRSGKWEEKEVIYTFEQLKNEVDNLAFVDSKKPKPEISHFLKELDNTSSAQYKKDLKDIEELSMIATKENL